MKPLRSPDSLHPQAANGSAGWGLWGGGEEKVEAEVAAFVARVLGIRFSEGNGHER